MTALDEALLGLGETLGRLEKLGSSPALSNALRHLRARAELLRPLATRIEADATRAAESQPVRKYFVVGKTDDETREARRIEKRAAPKRAIDLLSELLESDRAEKDGGP